MTSSPNPRYDGSGPPRPPKMPMGGPPPRRSEQRSNNFYDGIWTFFILIFFLSF